MSDRIENGAGQILDEVMERKRKLREELGIQPLPADAELFKGLSGSPKRHYAVVGGLNTWDGIAEGYRLGASKLADCILKSGYDQDYLVYPICFLYRCYLEIRLKEILVAAGTIDPSEYLHDLQSLWRDAKPLVEKYAGDPPEEIALIGRYIAQFNEVDPRGDGFRYPSERSGDRPHLPSVSEIDIGLLKQVMGSISGLLDGASTGIYEDSQSYGNT